MDEFDSCARYPPSPPDSLDEAGSSTPRYRGEKTRKRPAGEEHESGVTEKTRCLATAYRGEGVCRSGGGPSRDAPLPVSRGMGSVDNVWPQASLVKESPGPSRDCGGSISPLVSSGQLVAGARGSRSQTDPTEDGIIRTGSSAARAQDYSPNTLNDPGGLVCLRGDGSRANGPLRGADETDQGLRPAGLTSGQPVYPPQAANAKANLHYSDPEPERNFPSKPGMELQRSARATSLPTAAAGRAGQGPRPTAAPVSETAAASTAAASVQRPMETGCGGQQQAGTAGSLASQELAGESGQGPEAREQTFTTQALPSVQPDVQYSQNILSMPRQYAVSGTGNYLFDSPSNCTFHLYQNQSNGSSHKQHALQWAGLPSQTDGISDTLPTSALETIAKLIAQTTNWKTFARRLPMSESPDLEADIRALEDCQGTTSDKTSAVLMRWWKGQPGQPMPPPTLTTTAAKAAATATDGGGAETKARLREGLEACGLVRLARSLDKYL